MSTEESNEEEGDSFTSNGWRGREVRPERRRCNGERDLQKLATTINRKSEILEHREMTGWTEEDT